MAQNLRILVVEDEPETGRAVQRFLEFRGHRVDLAENLSAAIRLADEAVPEVMVCDWKLAKNEDGVEVASRVQSHHDIPIILVTAHRLSEAKRKAEESTVEISEFRRKPVSLSDLASLIESLGSKETA